jgi:hypothetical protein
VRYPPYFEMPSAFTSLVRKSRASSPKNARQWPRGRSKVAGYIRSCKQALTRYPSRGPGTVFVDPTQALSGIRETQGILADLQGDLSVCDPYVDGRTLDFLADCKAGTSIRLLTYNIKKPTAFERDVKAFNREHDSPLEVRVATAKVLHDRYIIHEGGMLLLGTSLNGLGQKQSFVVSIGQDLRSTTLQAFDALWSEGSASM